jgi:CHAT domain-containing protein
VWWLPTGTLVGLPLHAAGHHDDDQTPGRRVTIDRVVSSYAPSPPALARARTRRPEPPSPAVVVGVDGASAAPPMPRAAAEASWLAEYLSARDSAAVSSYVDDAATVAAVRGALVTAAWTHLACHAEAVEDWAESHLVLHDGALPVRALGGGRSYLAFLAGAGTGPAGPAGEPGHAGTALHLSGFAHVVATLWPPGSDRAFTESVYAQLAAGVEPAQAVHDASRQQRDRYPHHPYLWAPHIHLGP